jgi:tRNA G26 N,N-dimethylase Trm1
MNRTPLHIFSVTSRTLKRLKQTTSPSALIMTDSHQISIPEGFTLHSENNSHILLPSSNEAFLNPVQEFNRDISVACIRIWSEELNKAKEAKWRLAQERNATKADTGRPDKKRFKGNLEEDFYYPFLSTFSNFG